MLFLKSFNLLDTNHESSISWGEQRTCFTNRYPLGIFPERLLEELTFEPITIFYGGNGSGKSTLLNIIAEKLEAKRSFPYAKTHFFDPYLSMCHYEWLEKPLELRMITSDDIFNYLLDIKSINSGFKTNRDSLFQEYLDFKYEQTQMNDLSEYEEFRKRVSAKKKTMSGYVRENLRAKEIVEQSNGESALLFLQKEIGENAIYFLDEPENSLSAFSQLKLQKFIEESARFFNCQFLIATHSPFLLSLPAKIYDLDTRPVTARKWTELENVRIYHDFFKEHDEEFKK